MKTTDVLSRITPGTALRAQDVASAAALAKQRAKALGSGIYIGVAGERLAQTLLEN